MGGLLTISYVQKGFIRTAKKQKIVNDEIIFVPSEEANPQHSIPM